MTLFELNILRNKQFDMKVREIEIRARNLKKRQEREKLWKKGKIGFGKKEEEMYSPKKPGSTINNLIHGSNPRKANINSVKKKRKKGKGKGKGKGRFQSKGRKSKIGSQTSMFGSGNQFKKTEELSKKINHARKKAKKNNFFDTNINTKTLNLKTQKLVTLKKEKFHDKIPEFLRDKESEKVLIAFGAQSETIIDKMHAKISKSQEILNQYIEKVEKVIKGDNKERYLVEETEPDGFLEEILAKGQRQKYRKQFIMKRIEDKIGLETLYNNLKNEKNDEINIRKIKQKLQNVEFLQKEGKFEFNTIITACMIL